MFKVTYAIFFGEDEQSIRSNKNGFVRDGELPFAPTIGIALNIDERFCAPHTVSRDQIDQAFLVVFDPDESDSEEKLLKSRWGQGFPEVIERMAFKSLEGGEGDLS